MGCSGVDTVLTLFMFHSRHGGCYGFSLLLSLKSYFVSLWEGGGAYSMLPLIRLDSRDDGK